MFSYFFISSLFFIIFLSLTIVFVANSANPCMEKKVSFECGFSNLTANKSPFSTKFFMVMILFLVFDLEVAILLPSCMSQGSSLNPMVMTMIFVLILTVAMVVEWVNGIIEWSS